MGSSWSRTFSLDSRRCAIRPMHRRLWVSKLGRIHAQALRRCEKGKPVARRGAQSPRACKRVQAAGLPNGGGVVTRALESPPHIEGKE